MRVAMFHQSPTYLELDFQESFTEMGLDFKFINGSDDPKLVNSKDYWVRVIKDIQKLKGEFDLFICLNHWDYAAKCFPYDKTFCLFVDPPHHFKSCAYRGMQTTKVGPHPVLEWGVTKRWFAPTDHIKKEYEVLMPLRIDKAQESHLYQRDKDAFETFCNRNWLRVAGVIKAIGKYGFENVKILGEAHDWGRYFAEQDLPLLSENERIIAGFAPYDTMHLEFAKAKMIIDHVRPEVGGYNPKTLMALAQGIPCKNIVLNKGEVEFKTILKPQRIRTHVEMCEELIETAKKTLNIGG